MFQIEDKTDKCELHHIYMLEILNVLGYSFGLGIKFLYPLFCHLMFRRINFLVLIF